MKLAIATIIYLLAGALVAHLETRIDDNQTAPVEKWLHQEVYLPMLRAAALLLFMLLAYRSIFGLTDGHPGFAELVDFTLVSRSMNLLFILPFLLALLPNSAVFTPFLLPAQTLALTALVHLQIAERLGVVATLLPGGAVVSSLLIISVAGHLLSSRLPALLPANWNSRFNTCELGLIISQLPIFLVYGHALGQTLS